MTALKLMVVVAALAVAPGMMTGAPLTMTTTTATRQEAASHLKYFSEKELCMWPIIYICFGYLMHFAVKIGAIFSLKEKLYELFMVMKNGFMYGYYSVYLLLRNVWLTKNITCLNLC